MITDVELQPAEPVNNVLYVFSMDAATIFTETLAQIPIDEIGQYSVWNALKVKQKIFENEVHGKIYDYEPVWCLLTDFREEHANLRAQAEQTSLFYIADDANDRKLINEFFNTLPADYSQQMLDYLAHTSKIASE